MSNIGLNFKSRSGTKTEFTIKNNEYNRKNIDMCLKCVCFYTIAIFQTDSVEQKIIYDGSCFVSSGKIIDIINRYVQDYHLSDDECEIEDDQLDDSDDSICQKYDRDLIKSQLKSDKYDNIRHKPIKYRSGFKICRSRAMMSTGDDEIDATGKITCSDEDDKNVYDFKTDASYEVLRILERDKEFKDVPGNWGNHLLTNKNEDALEKDDINNGNNKNTYTDITSKYLAINVDKFNESVQVIKINDTKYKIKFRTGTKGIHHAASMWARDCLIEYKREAVIDIDYIDEIDADLFFDKDKIHITTTYYAVNVL